MTTTANQLMDALIEEYRKKHALEVQLCIAAAKPYLKKKFEEKVVFQIVRDLAQMILGNKAYFQSLPPREAADQRTRLVGVINNAENTLENIKMFANDQQSDQEKTDFCNHYFGKSPRRTIINAWSQGTLNVEAYIDAYPIRFWEIVEELNRQ